MVVCFPDIHNALELISIIAKATIKQNKNLNI